MPNCDSISPFSASTDRSYFIVCAGSSSSTIRSSIKRAFAHLKPIGAGIQDSDEMILSFEQRVSQSGARQLGCPILSPYPLVYALPRRAGPHPPTRARGCLTPQAAIGGSSGSRRCSTAIFRQINKDNPRTHHDALEFHDRCSVRDSVSFRQSLNEVGFIGAEICRDFYTPGAIQSSNCRHGLNVLIWLLERRNQS